MNIYVSNLSFDITNDDLKALFTPYGEVSSATVIMDKMSNRSRGFGFVEMQDETAATKAMEELNGSTVSGREIKVNEAKPKEDRGGGSRDGYRGGSNSGGGGRNFNKAGSYNQNRY
jgi:RNA recognition motif-containing protein